MPKPTLPIEDNRRKQILFGVAAILAVAGIMLLISLGRLIPGVVGECFAIAAGIATTPFFMEASLLILGFFTVLIINHWHRHREGDEFVYLDSPETPTAASPPGSSPDKLDRNRLHAETSSNSRPMTDPNSKSASSPPLSKPSPE